MKTGMLPQPTLSVPLSMKTLLQSLALVGLSCIVGLLVNQWGPALPIFNPYKPSSHPANLLFEHSQGAQEPAWSPDGLYE